jgi:hypothetical protein
MLTGLRSYHDWQRRQVLLQLLECLICFLSPDKGSGLPQNLEERESPLYQSRDKPTECSQASYDLMDILDASWQLHHFDRLDLLWIGLNSPVENWESEQLSGRDSEHVLVQVQHCVC